MLGFVYLFFEGFSSVHLVNGLSNWFIQIAFVRRIH